jgi:DNA methylase
MPIPHSGQEGPDLVHEPCWSDGTITLYTAEVHQALAELPAASVDCVVTQPPDLGTGRSAGAYVVWLRRVFGAVRRVLADDGTAWLALADSFGHPGGPSATGRHARRTHDQAGRDPGHAPHDPGARSLLGIPWQTAFAVKDDSWIVRGAAAWQDSAGSGEPAPGWVTSGANLIFLLVKQPGYWFEPGTIQRPLDRSEVSDQATGRSSRADSVALPVGLAMRCVAAGCRPGGVVLDTFCRTANVGTAAMRLGRRFIGIAPNAAACNRIRAELSQERSHDGGQRG